MAFGKYRVAHLLGITREHEERFREVEIELTKLGCICFAPAIYDFEIYKQSEEMLNDMCYEKLKVCDFCVLVTPEHVGKSTQERIRQAIEMGIDVFVWENGTMGNNIKSESDLQKYIDTPEKEVEIKEEPEYFYNPMGDLAELVSGATLTKMNLEEYKNFMRKLQTCLHNAFRIPYDELKMTVTNMNNVMVENGIPMKIEIGVFDQGEDPKYQDMGYTLLPLQAIAKCGLAEIKKNVERLMDTYVGQFQRGGFEKGMELKESDRFRLLFTAYYEAAYGSFFDLKEGQKHEPYGLNLINLLLMNNSIPYIIIHDQQTGVIGDVRKVRW